MSGVGGKVYLVGAGPGDPGLLTLRGRECLASADVVLHDGLANPLILQHAQDAELIDVRKVTDNHTLPQEEITNVLIREAKAGKRVVRLKGGDPFVFGRGGEEALALAKADVPFEIVAGVTSAVAAATYAGIPITQRGVAQSFSVITGHAASCEPSTADLARLGQEGTLVFMMAMKNIAEMVQKCIDIGRAPDTPVAVVEWATYPKQRTIVGTLETIVSKCEAADVGSPSVIIVGEAVRLSDQIAWFANRPLFGTRIVVTRAQEQASKFAKALIDLGADIFEYPTIAIEEPKEIEDFGDIGSYDWVVLTSLNGVNMLFDRLAERGHDARDLHGVKLCVVGAATADAVSKRFLNIDLMPEKYVAESLIESLMSQEESFEGKRFLLPRADIARSFLPQALREAGAEVVELVAYRTVKPAGSSARTEALMAYAPHLITFTSSSTARNFADLVGDDNLAMLRDSAAFGSIGPLTTETAIGLGMPITVEPSQHDIPHFVDAILEWRSRAAH